MRNIVFLKSESVQLQEMEHVTLWYICAKLSSLACHVRPQSWRIRLAAEFSPAVVWRLRTVDVCLDPCPSTLVSIWNNVSESTLVEQAFALCHMDRWNNAIPIVTYLHLVIQFRAQIQGPTQPSTKTDEVVQLTTELVTLTLSFQVGMTERWRTDDVCL